eukprot:2200147-Amphidinium_carterae.1
MRADRAYLIEGSFVVCKGIVDGKLPASSSASKEALLERHPQASPQNPIGQKYYRSNITQR